MTANRWLPAGDSQENALGRLRPQRPGAAEVAERVGESLGWLGGVATVYGPVSIVAAGATWGVISLGRFAALRLLASVSG